MDALNHSETGRLLEASPEGSVERFITPPGASSAASAATVYDLRQPGAGSDEYYADATRFANLFLDEAELRASSLFDGYGRHVQGALREVPRSRGEYAVEFVLLGLLLERYGSAAESAPCWAVELTRELLWLRRRSAAIKPLADFGRVVLGFLMLGSGAGETPCTVPVSRDRLPRLIEWLSASGEFVQEAMRINNWRDYLAGLSSDAASYWLGESVALFDWFQSEAKISLGSYTRGVLPYLATEAPRHRCREDRLMCGRDEVEYHLAMVAAEIMNRGMREEFEKTSRRIALVPACMRAEPARCRAQLVGLDLTCTACRSNCQVNRITRRLQSMGATVYLVPHSSEFSRWLARWQGHSDVGVTAVACLANIVSGGFEMRARGIASQCVLLDFPGCGRHWSRESLPTEVNKERLVQIATAQPPSEPDI